MKFSLKDTIKKNGLILNNDSNTKINSPLGLSMSGCGFLGSYHFGAVICIKKNSSVSLFHFLYFNLRNSFFRIYFQNLHILVALQLVQLLQLY